MNTVALSHKQRRFADEFIIDLNATRAAIRAGYSAHTAQEQASRLLCKVMVQQAIQQRMDSRIARVELHQDYVLRQLQENLERCNQPVPVLDAQGGETGRYRSMDASAANKASELLMKHLGMFTDKRMNLNYSVGLEGTGVAPEIETAFRQQSIDQILHLLDMAI